MHRTLESDVFARQPVARVIFVVEYAHLRLEKELLQPRAQRWPEGFAQDRHVTDVTTVMPRELDIFQPCVDRCAQHIAQVDHEIDAPALPCVAGHLSLE